MDAQQSNLNFDSILIVTYGRSGSTLLQGLLNQLDGIFVRGENGDAFGLLWAMYRRLAILKREHGTYAKGPSKPWYGIGAVKLDVLLGQMREMAKSIILADQKDNPEILCYGFKEIRYHYHKELLPNYLDFLSVIFPRPAIIFNTRDLSDVVRSGWWANSDPEGVRQELSAAEKQFSDYAAGKSNCFEITYEDVVGRTEKLRDLFAFLGVEYNDEIVQRTLSKPHSINPTQASVKSLFNARQVDAVNRSRRQT